MTPTNPLGTWIEVMSIAFASVMGFVVGGLFAAAAFFALTSTIVFMRALRRSRAMLREPEVPELSALAPAQAMKVLSALRGEPLHSDALARVEELERLAEQAPERALVQLDELVTENPRSVPALLLRARLQFELEHGDAASSWSRALTLALDGGLNVLAAKAFDRHVAHREQLELDRPHLIALGKALAARGHDDDAAWCRARASV
jgi:hypothetical protein